MNFLFRFYFMIQEISKKIRDDDINAHAASASFFIIVCFFPMIILLLSFIKYTPITEEMLLTLSAAAPVQLQDILFSVIDEIYSRSSVTILSVTAIATLWTAGKSFLAISDGLRKIYNINQQGYFLGRILSSIYTLVFVMLIILLMIVITIGEMLSSFLDSYFPLISPIAHALFSNKYLIIFLLSTLTIMLVYTFIPRRHSTVIRQFPGAIFSAGGWILFTYVYSRYTSYSQGFSYMYGSLTSIVFIMLWLYFCMYIFFLGAEFNTFMELKILNIGFLWKHHHKKSE